MSDPENHPTYRYNLDPALLDITDSVAERYRLTSEQMLAEARYHGNNYRTHFNFSRNTIINTALIASDNAKAAQTPSRALLLGTGNCSDIPLDLIAQNFDEIVLVDTDITATERAVMRLPHHLLGKLSLIGADVSGIVPQLSTAMEQAIDASPTYAEFVHTMLRSLRSIDPTVSRRPELGRGFSFVCSQLLLSQLCVMPFANMAEELLPRRYRTAAALGEIDNNLETELINTAESLQVSTQLEHISQLRKLVADNGTVHFADTYKLESAEAGQPLKHTILDDSVFQPHIDHHFDRLAPAVGWEWRLSPLRVFSVMSHSLVPRLDHSQS